MSTYTSGHERTLGHYIELVSDLNWYGQTGPNIPGDKIEEIRRLCDEVKTATMKARGLEDSAQVTTLPRETVLDPVAEIAYQELRCLYLDMTPNHCCE